MYNRGLTTTQKKLNPYQIFIIFDSCQLFLILCLAQLARVQSQVDEVIDVMQENISKVIERGERLDDLQDKSGESHRDSVCFDVQSQMKLTQTLSVRFALMFSSHM